VRDLPSLKQRNNTGQLLAAAWSRPPAERGSASAGGASLASNFDGMACLITVRERGAFPACILRLGGVIDRDRLAPAAVGLIPYSKMSKKQKNLL
jgi:hypothetical protein